MGTHPIFESDFDCLTECRRKMDAEEAILGALSPEEIACLVDQLEEIDPENELLPAGYRQLNQTDKKPTGEFNRDSLLEYLEEQARSQPEIEDYVPHIPGQKKGKIYKPKQEQKKSQFAVLEPDIEAALGEIDGVDLSELAEILGETAINSHVELGKRGLSNDEETGLRRIYRPDYRDPIEESNEPELNPADIEEDLRRIQEQDPTMTVLNWNNLRETPIGHLIALCRALEYNQYLKELYIANTRANDQIGECLCKVLKVNDTIEVLNIESNFISSEKMSDIVHEACASPVLKELRIDNQRNSYGERTETLFCDSIAEGSGALQKLSYSWRCPGPRQRSQVLLLNNRDKLRLKRNGP